MALSTVAWVTSLRTRDFDLRGSRGGDVIGRMIRHRLTTQAPALEAEMIGGSVAIGC